MRPFLLAAASFLACADAPPPSHAFATGTQPGAPWPTLAHDAARSGFAAVHGPRNANVRWKAALGSPAGTASPVIAADGTIYIGSHGGALHAFDANGMEKWHVDLPGTIEGAAAIAADGNIWVGCDDARIRVLSPDGRIVQSTLLRSSISGILLEHDGTAYVTASDAHGYAVAPGIVVPFRNFDFFGIMGTRLLANEGFGLTLDFPLSPISTDGRTWHSFGYGAALCATDDGLVLASGEQLFMLDASRKQQWSAHLIPQVFYYQDPPIPIRCGFDSAHTTYVHVLGMAYAIDAKGTLRWTTQSPTTYGPIAIDIDGTSYFGADDGVHALDANGKTLFTLATGAPVRSSPALGADGTLYIGSDDGFLWAVSP